ncbi:MAG: hypothetical protein LBB55_07630 [Zoogloeaceae bacterium]|nr:hypothetical protein [Zoogloeaceae bacterium]
MAFGATVFAGAVFVAADAVFARLVVLAFVVFVVALLAVFFSVVIVRSFPCSQKL